MTTLDVAFAGDEGTIMVVRLNRPEVLNAMNTRMMEEMLALFREQASNDALRAAVITGAGGRAFSTGADLKERDTFTEADWRRQHRLAEEKMLAVRDFPVPVIAAVEGYAYAGGCELALMCDFIVAGTSARFALTEVRRGIVPGGGGLQNLPRAIGVRRAKELVYTGRPLDAATAYAWGLVNRVVPDGEALATALAIAEEIAASAPLAVRMAKVALTLGPDADFRTGYALDIASHYALIGTEDRREGVRAFNEKRPPRWQNR
ncbi:MAG: enoyl-CoA hydratase/isomerase family protein [Actinomycetia bacterium]|nr:enoyl-CoA hydratase/isomerase family protein [Actinomycetes bacterium]